VHAFCLLSPKPVAAEFFSTRFTQRMEARPINPSAAPHFHATANLLHALPLLLVVWHVDAQHGMWHGGQAVARTADNDLPTLMDRLHPLDVNRLRPHFNRVAALPDGSYARQRFRLRQADGGWCQYESHDTVLLRHADGRAAQLAVCGHDISERQGAEGPCLTDRRALAADLHDETPLAVIEWGSDFRVWRWAGAGPAVPSACLAGRPTTPWADRWRT